MRTKQLGVTLLEVLLVLAITGGAFAMYTNYVMHKTDTLRIDRTIVEVQEILNAAKVYYIENGKWPGDDCVEVSLSSGSASLMQPKFLPANAKPTVWQTASDSVGYYTHYFCSSTSQSIEPMSSFVVKVEIGSSAERQTLGGIIAGMLPFAKFDAPYLYAWTLLPAENLSKLKGIKFGGLYHHGACVPEPVCPTISESGGIDTIPQLFLIPISVSGTNDTGSTSTYNLTSFTAYASGDPAETPDACVGSTSTPACTGANDTGRYWRACAQVISERGDLQTTRTDDWGEDVTMAAFTRCTTAGEKTGSDLTIYGD